MQERATTVKSRWKRRRRTGEDDRKMRTSGPAERVEEVGREETVLWLEEPDALGWIA